MRVCNITKLLSVIMAVVFPVSMMMADTRAAMLYTSGHATLNGAGVAHSTAVFAGDTIQTPSDSAATINLAGSTVLLPADSSIQFQGDAIELQSGSAVVSTSKGLKALVGDLSVGPAKGSAKYEVSTKDGEVLIAARTGSLALTGANGTTYLQEGDSTTAGTKKKKRRAGAVPAVGTTTTAGMANGMGTGTAIAIGVGAAAVIAGIAIATGDSPRPMSPAR